MKTKGSCLCGAIQFEVDNHFKATMNCHCKFCRKAHSAVFVTATIMPQSDLTFTQGEEYIKKVEVPGSRKRCFCELCGTRIFNEISVPGIISFMVGTLDTPEIAQPIGHVNVESKLPSYQILDDLPQYQAFPPQEVIASLVAGNPS